MTPHHIIAKIRERFPELQGVESTSSTGWKNISFAPIQWSHVLMVLGNMDLLDYKMHNDCLYINRVIYDGVDVDNIKVDLTQKVEHEIKCNTDFASLLERCLTE